MTDITKLKKDLETNQKSLTSRINDLKTKIENINKHKDKTILCDVSGSMGTWVDSSTAFEEKRAIDVVNHVLESFKGCNLWEFSGINFIKKVTKLDEPQGSTAMHAAFDVMKGQNIKEFILITDGAPDSPVDTLKSAQGLKIHIIYIGPQPTPQFLLDLAKVGSNTFIDVELIKLGAAEGSKELENKVRLMLNA